MRKAIVVVVVLLLAVFAVGCSTDASGGAYQPPSGPIGGGCGISAPADVGAEAISAVGTGTQGL